jgi:tetrahydromethanopterin S-methyltransferase subunit G
MNHRAQNMPSEEQTYRQGIKDQLDRIENKVEYTNGKVRKTIIALILAFGLIVGMGFEQMAPILTLLLAA